MDFYIFVIILVFILYFRSYFRSYQVAHGLKCLPGPRGIPFLGYLPFLGKDAHKTYVKLGRQYGDIFIVKVGMHNVLVLNSYEVIKEAYSNINFCGRPNIPSIQTIVQTFANVGGSRFTFKTANAQWKFLRRAAIKAISMFASSRNTKLKDTVQGATSILVQTLEGTKGASFNPKKAVLDCVAGVIGSVTFGTNFNPKHPIIKNLVHTTDTVGRFIEIGSVLDFFPFGRWIMSHKVDHFVKEINAVSKLNEKHILERRPSDQVRDLADVLWKTAMETPADEKRALRLTDTNIRAISEDLFGAGFGTTMETCLWMLLLLAAHQEIQERARQQIQNVLGAAEPSMERKTDLPLVEALLLEMFRWASLVPLGLPHATMQDLEFRGYFVPKNCIVFANFYGHHYNPAVFSEPDVFRPERFLIGDNTGKTRVDLDQANKVIPFSIGKRRCPGENFARQELFLLLTTLLQNFRILPCTKGEIDMQNCTPGFTRRSLEQNYVFERIL